MGNVSRLRLKQEKEIAVFLRLVIVGKKAFLEVYSIFEMVCDFVLL